MTLFRVACTHGIAFIEAETMYNAKGKGIEHFGLDASPWRIREATMEERLVEALLPMAEAVKGFGLKNVKPEEMALWTSQYIREDGSRSEAKITMAECLTAKAVLDDYDSGLLDAGDEDDGPEYPKETHNEDGSTTVDYGPAHQEKAGS